MTACTVFGPAGECSRHRTGAVDCLTNNSLRAEYWAAKRGYDGGDWERWPTLAACTAEMVARGVRP